MVIMRIHYAWKEWFAKEQSGDFMWRQVWDPAGKDTGILCHNFPYDIYRYFFLSYLLNNSKLLKNKLCGGKINNLLLH